MDVSKLKEILDYWHTIEFLNQSDYPTKKQVEKKTLNFRRHGYEVNEYSDISNFINDSSEKKKYPETGDTIEVCIGKMARETCIEVLYQKLNIKDERIEFAKGSIAILGLQITSLKNYVSTSFNVSPLIWLISKIENNTIEDISTILSEKAYIEDMQEYGKWLASKEKIDNHVLMELYEKVCKQFIFPSFKTLDSVYQGHAIIQRFSSLVAKEKNFDLAGFSNLQASFFSKDIKMVEKNICHESNGKSIFDSFLRKYIMSAYDRLNDDKKDERINILKDTKETRALYEHYMNIKNMPLGKWPAKFAPSFMQQFAINQAIQMQKEKAPSYMSVNGPPGTGKTTMLKEIIADSVVRKAMIMSSFEHADDAFEECSFQHGDKINNGYHDWPTYSHYYKIDKRIQDYALMVASYNNAAVENITKELPNGELLCKNIHTEYPICSNDNALMHLHTLFEKAEDNEIFFTKYAHVMFNDKDHNDYYWGLISVPLGNRGNMNTFKTILREIFNKEMMSNEMIESHINAYKEAKEQFQQQLHIVTKIQNEVYATQELLKRIKKAIDNCVKKKEELKQEYIDKQEEQEKIHLKLSNMQNMLNEMKVLLRQSEEGVFEQEKIVAEKNKDVQENEVEILKYQELIKVKEDERKFMDYLFMFFHKETMRIREIKKLYTSYDRLHEKSGEFINTYNEALIPLRQAKDKQQDISRLVDSQQDKLNNAEGRLLEIKGELMILDNELAKIRNVILVQEHDYQEQIDRIKQNSYESFVIMDENFWDRFYSEKEEDKIGAQLKTPWLSKHYQRESEKLFYYALHVIREFILSSKRARCNIKNLLMMWNDNETIHYDNRDQKSSFPYLLQTLQAMIPIISTTFASVQQFLGNVDAPMMIGTLMIDEAGQAQPHVALGAMYRSKHVIAVGDPNQVEPVVTTELDALKHLIKKETIIPYMKKSLSIQELVDYLNPFGTEYIDDGEIQWVGSPLVVHRRCISPMFEISNAISYNNIMYSQTSQPSEKVEDTFALPFSQWKNVKGKENSHKQKDHFVKEQGDKAIEIIHKAFQKAGGEMPSLYVISPFKSVIEGLRSAIMLSKLYSQFGKDKVDDFIDNHCGTVHTFQGKEANEVIFLLGCDIDATGSINWVNKNIINVAVSRAKYRLCVLGDFQAWKSNRHMFVVKNLMDAYTLRELKRLEATMADSVDSCQVQVLVDGLPDMSSFLKNDKNSDVEEIEENRFLQGLELDGDYFKSLTQEDKLVFHMTDDVLQQMSDNTRKRVICGIKVSQLFTAIEEKFGLTIEEKSSANILFCKAIECHTGDCFIASLKRFVNHAKTRKADDFTLGVIKDYLKNNKDRLPALCVDRVYDLSWWNSYVNDLELTGNMRNECCHSEIFKAEDQALLRELLFEKDLFSRTLAGKKLAISTVQDERM